MGPTNGQYKPEMLQLNKRTGATIAWAMRLAVIALLGVIGIALYLTIESRNDTAIGKLIKALDANTRSRYASQASN